MWEILIPLIVKEGITAIPIAEALWKKWTSGADPTQADWDELRALASSSANAKMMLVLGKHGIPLDSPQGLALLALTK